jgi:hypothetical protein
MHSVVVYRLAGLRAREGKPNYLQPEAVPGLEKAPARGCRPRPVICLVGQTLVFIRATGQSFGYGRNANVLQGHNESFQGNLQNLIHGFDEM